MNTGIIIIILSIVIGLSSPRISLINSFLVEIRSEQNFEILMYLNIQ